MKLHLPLVASFLGSCCCSIVNRFTLVIDRKALAGRTKEQVVVNGTVPGPTLRVKVGDRVEVLVINQIYHENTLVHWHGLRQHDTPYSDGVPGVTQVDRIADFFGSWLFNFGLCSA